MIINEKYEEMSLHKYHFVKIIMGNDGLYYRFINNDHGVRIHNVLNNKGISIGDNFVITTGPIINNINLIYNVTRNFKY